MDIHKPKAVHDWRELLDEIVVIVIGVLIALAAEQAVEMLRWRHEVEAERSALLAEARRNLGAAAYRQGQQACIARRLDEIAVVFDRKAAGRPLGLKRPVGKPPIDYESRGTWQIAVAGQALAHMTLKEKLDFSDAFDTYTGFADLRLAEDAVWIQLQGLDLAADLTESDWTRLHEAWTRARSYSDRMSRLTLPYLFRHAALGQKSDPVDARPLQSAMGAFCAPLI